jgi:hypothetical protein
MVAKSKNPEYMQLYSYVPRTIGVKFKALCASRELEQSAVVEELIAKWIEDQEKEQSR